MKNSKNTNEQFLIEIGKLKDEIAELEKFRLIGDNTTDFISIVNLDGKYIYASPSYKLLGYNPDKLIGSDGMKLLHPDDRKRMLPMLKQVISGFFKKGTTKRFDLRLLDKSGKYRDIESIAKLIKDNSGKYQVLAVVRDITERKRAEEINKVMFDISNAVNITQNLDDLYQSIHKSLHKIIDVTNFFIAIVDVKKRTLHFPYHVDTTDDNFSSITNFDTNDSLTGLVASKRKPILLAKTELKARTLKNGVWGPTPLIWMGVPLIVKDEVIGVVAVQSYEDPDLYNVNDLQILTAVSNQMAIAIDRKRAKQEVQQHTEDLTLINNINTSINRGGDLQSILKLFAKETRSIYECNSATVYMISNDKKYLEMQHLSTLPVVTKQIEKLIRIRIPQIQVPLKEGSLINKLLLANEPYFMHDPQTIQNWMMQFTKTTYLPNKLRPFIRKLIPQIYKILGIKSFIIIPLISEGESIGLLEITHREPFSLVNTKRIINVAEQITVVIKRLLTNIALKENEYKLQTLFDSANDGIFIVDKESEKILNVNPKATYLHGYSRDELIDMPVATLFRKKDLPSIKKNINQLIKDGSIIFEGKQICKDGRLIDVEVSSRVFLYDGREVFNCLVRDITDRKQIEGALSKSEEKFRSIFEGANDGIIQVDKTIKVLSVNQALIDITGVPKDSIIGKNGFDLAKKLINIKQLPKVLKTLKKMVATGQFDFLEINFQDKILGISAKLQNTGEIVGIIRDITIQKQAEEALRESEMRLFKFINSAIDSFTLWDSELNLIELNKTELDWQEVGTKREDLLGKNWSELVPDLKETERYNKYMEVIKTGNPLVMDRNVPNAKFGDKIFNVRAFKVGDGLGVISRDITEQKQAYKKIKESEKKYRSLIESNPDGVMSIGLTGKVLSVNKAFEELTGFNKEAIVGKHILKIPTLIKQDLDFYMKTFKEIISGMKFDIIEFKWKNANGDIRDGEAKTSTIKQADKIIGIQAILRDITEHKRAQEQLQTRNRELEIWADVTTGRELKMIEMKKEINELLEKSGKKPKYKIPV